MDSPTKQLRVNWMRFYVNKDDERGGGPNVPVRPGQSFRRLHHLTLLLANYPYLVRNTRLGGSWERGGEVNRTLMTMDEGIGHGNLGLGGARMSREKTEGLRGV
jgi:hypothetical protein